ncbi:MAG: helix-turn-helix domain-containing protein [Oscillospiraceae bacterium]|jgi:transcriptional regulator with XRE-family HTH domain|nr:helix-turn-helix domain-containing protein [Oscillospiraceae bacterium]
MELHIATQLKHLRKQRDLTQEELAEILSVTPQAISKWERGEGYPDIVILPGIAAYFGVTLDALFGMEDRDRLAAYHAQWKACNDAGENESAVRVMREALRKYPGEALLLVQLVTSLEKCGGSPEQTAQNRAEAIALSERLTHCDDPEIRNAFLFNLCHSYWKNGEPARAIERAHKLPNSYKTRENALVMFLEGDEKTRQGREGILTLAGSLFHQGLCMAQACKPEEAIAILSACCNAAQALYPCEDVPELLRQQAAAHLKMAEAALQLLQNEEALGHLERCIDFARRSRCEAPAAPRSPLAAGLETPGVSAAAYAKLGLARLPTDEAFRPLAGNARWAGIVEQATQESIASPPTA